MFDKRLFPRWQTPTEMLRADRLATLCFFHPLRRLLGDTEVGIPILMYHSISTTAETKTSNYFRTFTDPRTFLEQMEFLSRLGYESIGVSEAIRKLDAGTQRAGKFVALTFDDGYADFYRAAFPTLTRFGYKATVYLPTAHIADTPLTFNSKPCLTWGEVRELRKAGIEFGSHTVRHPQLAGLATSEIQEELRVSKQEIENRLGEEVESFAYPYAFPEADRQFRQRLREMLAENGYRTGVSTIIGTARRSSDRFFLERLPVNSCDDETLLNAKLTGGYDWLHAVQATSKVFRRVARRGTASRVNSGPGIGKGRPDD